MRLRTWRIIFKTLIILVIFMFLCHIAISFISTSSNENELPRPTDVDYLTIKRNKSIKEIFKRTLQKPLNKHSEIDADISLEIKQIQKRDLSKSIKNQFYEYLQEIEQKKDWHDHKSIAEDLQRVGFGEGGNQSFIADLELKISLENGFNAMLSDLISVNRSVPDIRDPGCRTKLYNAKLPKVSVVMPFFNEHVSVLLRSMHSIVNRSPPELLAEIILVDDCSDVDYLFKPLDAYILEHFTNVKIIHLPRRVGLIRARLAGARNAQYEVIVFLDSHIEANYNWLPPLLEPIAYNKRAVVCPLIDVISHDTFSYSAQDHGGRGVFDWDLLYRRLPLLPEDLVDRTNPFKSPVMAGGLVAITADFFWELGGYDDGLEVWGGEQYELSFKIWMCGGQLLDAPCSRIAHIFRGPRNSIPSISEHDDVVSRNYKRVAEVWMDEYKEYVYARNRAKFDSIDPGNLTDLKAHRKHLKCKSFKWFMTNIAFDLPVVYPFIEPEFLAKGAIQSLGAPNLCIDSMNNNAGAKAGLHYCAKNLTSPHSNQNWALSYRQELQRVYNKICLDVNETIENAPVWLWECHGSGGNQDWYYDHKNKLLRHSNTNRCLEAKPNELTIVVNICNLKNTFMKWNFAWVNYTALDLLEKHNA